MKWGERIARFLVPDEFAALEKERTQLDHTVSQRVAEVLLKMDPFEPLMKKYNIIFSEEWNHPEDKLDDQSQLRMYMWAAGVKNDSSFRYLTDWIRNTQGNATLRKGKHADEWLYGRAAVATISLFVDEVGRLASHYEEILERRKKGEFSSVDTV